VLDPDARKKAKAKLRVIIGEKSSQEGRSQKKPEESLRSQLDSLQRKAGVFNIEKSMTLPELLNIIQADKLGYFDCNDSDS
jgi:hypothetical protein